MTEQLAIVFLGDRIDVRAVLLTQESVTKLIEALEANKVLLRSEDKDHIASLDDTGKAIR